MLAVDPMSEAEIAPTQRFAKLNCYKQFPTPSTKNDAKKPLFVILGFYFRKFEHRKTEQA